MVSDDKWVQRWIMPSSRGGGTYTVAKDEHGNYACSCPGWTRHTPRTDCKHIREVRAGRGTTLEQYTIDRLAGRA